MSEFYTILVVDDDASVLMAMQHALKREGYDVHTAVDGIQALEIARETPPDLILCDYMMPQMNGVATFQAISEICPDAVRILVTGHADLEVAMSAINEGGVYKFVLKPWNTKDLGVLVRRALEHYQLIQEGKALMEMLDMALRQMEVKSRGLQDQIDRYRRMLGMD
jgi:DNA-binding NtrC family response regulator